MGTLRETKGIQSNLSYDRIESGPTENKKVKCKNIKFLSAKTLFRLHMGPEDPSNRKKCPSFFFQAKFSEIANGSKNVSL